MNTKPNITARLLKVLPAHQVRYYRVKARELGIMLGIRRDRLDGTCSIEVLPGDAARLDKAIQKGRRAKMMWM